MLNCEGCPFKDKHTVGGRGPDQADLVFLAESPGYEEHAQGKILVGQSGQLLAAVCNEANLGEIGIDSYLSNATLCTPPDTPEAKTLATYACRDRVKQELLSRKPKLIVSLGGFAALSLFGENKGITRRVGEIKDWNGIPVLLNVHPAYLLRGGYEDFFTFVNGLKLANRILSGSGRDSMEVPYDVCTDEASVEEALSSLQGRVDNNLPISLDLETSGFNPYAIAIQADKTWRKDRIILICLGTEDKSYLITEQGFKSSYEAIKGFLEQSDIKLVFHVAVFDAGFLKAAGIDVKISADTNLMHFTTDERKYTHGLKELARITFGASDWEADIKQYLPSPKKSSYELIPTKALAKYASYDGVFTSRLYDHLSALLGEDEHRLLNTVIMPALDMYLETRHRGTRINAGRLLQIAKAIKPRMDELTEELRKISGRPNLNPSSPLQCAKVIYDELKLQRAVYETTTRRLKIGAAAKGLTERSTNEDALLEIFPKHPFVIALLEYRELKQDLSHSIYGMLPFMDENGRIHPQIDLTAAVNGRIASSLPSVLNVKRPPKIVTDYNDLRSIYVADEGWLLFEADESQFELRNYAGFGGISEMLRAFRSGEDIHDFTDKLFNLHDRVRAKAINFGIVYGLSLMSLAQRLGVDPKDAAGMKEVTGFYQLLQERMPGIKQFEDLELNTIRAEGQLVNPLGRKRRFPLITDTNWHKIRNEGLNFRTSSTSSDLNLIAAAKLHKREAELGINIFWTIHDSILGQVRKDCLSSLEEVTRMMTSTPATMLGEPFTEVKYAAEVKIGENWGHMKKQFEMAYYQGSWTLKE